MPTPRLQVVAVGNNSNAGPRTQGAGRHHRLQSYRAKADRAWLHGSAEDPASGIEQLRIESTLAFISDHILLSRCSAVDIGCGGGQITRYLQSQCHTLLACDASAIALRALAADGIATSLQTMPVTTLRESAYDLVVSTDVIAELESGDHRLYMSELARVVTADGHVVCSTALDIDSLDALALFVSLVQTEFEIIDSIVRSDTIHARLSRWLATPRHYWQCRQHKEQRLKEMKERKGIHRLAFALQTTAPLAWMWRGVALLTTPLLSLITRSSNVAQILETASRTLWGAAAVTHITLIGRRRKLFT